MSRILITMLSGLLFSPGTWAVCTLESGMPTTVSIPSQLITLSADASVDTVTPIAYYDSPMLGADIVYYPCDTGTPYGKSVINLSGQDSATKIYPTAVPGIGVKLLWNNGGGSFGNFPSTQSVAFPSGSANGRWVYNPNAFYRIQFFKTGDNIRLNNPETGDTLLPPGDIAYNYLVIDSPASYAMKLMIGEIKIISTPSCNTTGAQTVNFFDVTPTKLRNRDDVTKPLNFGLVCKTDYGTYSAKASMITTTPSADGSYIRAEDAAGNKDTLGIEITDGNNQAMKIDGSTSELRSSITSQAAGEFNWQATLVPGSKTRPAGGVFNAKAEIVFDIQ